MLTRLAVRGAVAVLVHLLLVLELLAVDAVPALIVRLQQRRAVKGGNRQGARQDEGSGTHGLSVNGQSWDTAQGAGAYV